MTAIAETNHLFDIYEDTCLHAGVLADKVAANLDPENETLGKTLEAIAVIRYRRLPAFRGRLTAVHNKSDAPEEQARIARDWLEATMTRWGTEILAGTRHPVSNPERFDKQLHGALEKMAAHQELVGAEHREYPSDIVSVGHTLAQQIQKHGRIQTEQIQKVVEYHGCTAEEVKKLLACIPEFFEMLAILDGVQISESHLGRLLRSLIRNKDEAPGDLEAAKRTKVEWRVNQKYA
jgi:hypothetical protein